MEIRHTGHFDGESGVYYDHDRDSLFLLFRAEPSMVWNSQKNRVDWYPRFDIEFSKTDKRKNLVITDGDEYLFVGDF